MDEREITLARLAAGQHGVVSRCQALASGLTSKFVRERAEAGLLLRLHEGVYRHAAVPLTREGRLLAAIVAAGPGAVASHRSAAALHGFHHVPRWRPELTVLATDLPLRSGIHVHRTNLLDAIDRTVVAGVPCTARPRTFLDLGAVLPYEIVEETVQDAVIRKLVSHVELVTVLERVGRSGRPGTARLRAVVRHALPDERLESELERRLSLLFPPGHGLELQHPFTCADGRRVRFDAARPDLRIAIEAVGHRWHATAKKLREDMARRRSIEASGWSLYEYGWADVTETPDDVRAELARILACTLSDVGRRAANIRQRAAVRARACP